MIKRLNTITTELKHSIYFYSRERE